MIEPYSLKEQDSFFSDCGISQTRVRNESSRDYAVRTAGGILVSLHDYENTQAYLWIGQKDCRLLTSSGSFLKAAAEASHTDESSTLSASSDAARFFQTLTKDDPTRIRELENDISTLEESFLEGKKTDKAGLRQILRYHRTIHRMTMYFERLELMTDELAQLDPSFVPIDHLFDKLCAAVRRTQNHLETVREAYQSQIDIEQNTIMKVLTIVTTLVLPLTLITGWYGMNLQMPEYNWPFGYPLIICLSAVILIVLILYFKHRKWF